MPVTVITMQSGERLKANEAMLWNVNSNPRGDQEET